VLELRHGKAAGQTEGGNVIKVSAAVALRAKVEHTAAPQAVLHARLHHEAQIDLGKALRSEKVGLRKAKRKGGGREEAGEGERLDCMFIT
jgi:hypothetical protein